MGAQDVSWWCEQPRGIMGRREVGKEEVKRQALKTIQLVNE
jgi:hypothetical protein